VDGSGDTAAAYKPRSADEMTKITALVKSAMGFDQARGDQVQVTNMQFAPVDIASEGTPAAEPLLGVNYDMWFKLAQVLILSVTALLVFLLVVKPMIRRLTTQTAAGTATAIPSAQHGAQAAIPNSEGAMQVAAATQLSAPAGAPQYAIPKRESIDVSQIEGQVRESSIRKIGDVVQAHPEEAMAILRTWLHQPV